METIAVAQLNPALAGQYEVINTHCPRVLNTIVGDIDFITLTPADAETLVNAGFTYLQRATPAAPAKAKPERTTAPI